MYEIIRLQNSNNRDGMKKLYEAYKKFELREDKTLGRTSDNKIARAQKNMDDICRVADQFLNQEKCDKEMAFITCALEQPSVIGKTQNFYRQTIQYRPIQPTFN